MRSIAASTVIMSGAGPAMRAAIAAVAMAGSVDLDVVGLGFCCIDELLLLSEIPGPEGRALIRQRGTHGGGMVATAMVATAKLGGRAGFIGKVGDDGAGQAIAAEFG